MYIYIYIYTYDTARCRPSSTRPTGRLGVYLLFLQINTTLYYIIPYYTTPYYTILYYIVLYFVVLYCGKKLRARNRKSRNPLEEH